MANNLTRKGSSKNYSLFAGKELGSTKFNEFLFSDKQ